MKPKYILSFFLIAYFIGFNGVIGQNITKNTIQPDNEICTYFTIQPKERITGIVLLLPGRGESPRQVFRNTSLPKILAAKGYLIVMPVLSYSLFADKKIKSQITQVIRAEIIKNNLNKPNLFLGGFSAGGSVALSYAEYLLSSDTATSLKGIFVIDPPIDLERLYLSAERMLNYNCGELIYKEATITKHYLDQAFGGSPSLNPEKYLAISPYSANSPDGGNAKWLKNIAIRLYSEPDLQFVQKKYCEELRFEDINAFDLESLKAFLLKIGNRKSEYIKTAGKGFHSWNIIDPDELTNWMINVSKEY